MKSSPVKNIIRLTWLLLWACCMVFTSCSQYQTDDPDQGNPSQTGGQKMSLRIATVGNGTRGEEKGDEVSEKIKSLRIVIISDCFIEYNQKFDYSQTEGGIKNAEGTIHTLERSTVAGNKKFYLIANEESVPEISFDNISDEELREIEGIGNLKEGILSNGMSLTEFLEYFVKDKLPAEGTLDYLNSGTGSQFEKLINSAYFCPDLEVKDNTIYLPYTSYYEGIKAGNNPEETVAATMYLVPVATKFTFNLYNYRNQPVVLERMTFRALNPYNYLYAQLDDGEKRKSYNGKPLWWVDWLQKVAEDTNYKWENSDHPKDDLEDYNQRVGWIENYFLPLANETTNDPIDKSLEKYEGEIWEVDRLRNIDEPPIINVVRYFPESFRTGKRKVFDEDGNTYSEIECQLYQLQFKVHEIREGNIVAETHTSSFMDIDNLSALFRGTHVIIEVDMYESVVQVFCRIEQWGWNKKPYLGYVQEDDDDDD
ncbi:MAG: hypothetical protein J1E95_08790 [Muribaculaceae bacterium]|nr:hypothetical protein [Muribaculaceae bacterium]